MSCNVSNDALSTSKQNPMTRKKSGSILKKQSSFRNKKKKKKKYNQDEQSTPGKKIKQQSVGFIVPDYDPSQEEKEHQQVVDEIYEAYNLEITVVHDGRDIPETEESLVGKTFRIEGDEVISFGSSNSATVVLPTEHFVKTEATIRMWGSQYYMFSGRKTETLGKKTCWCCILLCVV